MDQIPKKYQQFLDFVAPFILYRWISSVAVLLLFCIRIILVQGYYIIAYALGIYLLNLFLAFLTPMDDPSTEEGPTLPTTNDEFKPFVRRLPEFKFWLAAAKAILVSFICSFLPFLDIPVFWPILVVYFIVLFILTMQRQIRHMIKHKYVPFNWGKQSY